MDSDPRSHFAWVRTRYSVERTFLAWIRTSVSLIGFGFSVHTFFQKLQTLEPGAPRAVGPTYFGLGLIAMGVFAAVMAIWQHWSAVSFLEQPVYAEVRTQERLPLRGRQSIAAAVCLALIGTAAFVSILLER